MSGSVDREQPKHAPATTTEQQAPGPAPTRHQERTGADVAKLATDASVRRFAYPAQVDLGDTVVGDRPVKEVFVYALDAPGQGPRIEATVTGDPAFSLELAPLFLPGSGGFDASTALRLGFHPTRSGTFTGRLSIHVLDATNETIHIPLEAGAHFRGGMTRAEESAAARAAQERAAAEATERADRERSEQGIAAERKRAEPYHQGYKSHLETMREEVRIATNHLNKAQSDALLNADREIGRFVRAVPAAAGPSLLEQLAWAALDLATAGIAGAVAAGVKPAVKNLLTKHVHALAPHPMLPGGIPVAVEATAPTEAMVALVTDGLKHLVKGGGKGVKGAIEKVASLATGNSPSDAPSSVDPKAAFFEIQQREIAAIGERREHLTTIDAHDALLPLLRTAPDLAIDTMHALAVSLESARGTADTAQMNQTVQHWVQYVYAAHEANANHSFSQEQPLEKIDGLIDVRFTANLDPHSAVTPVTARLNGVRKTVVEHLAKSKLIDLEVPVRATSDLGSASASITIVREADGAIRFTDNSWTPGTWLERRAQSQGFGPDAPRAARRLIEQEIMSKSLFEIVGRPDVKGVENDSKD